MANVKFRPLVRIGGHATTLEQQITFDAQKLLHYLNLMAISWDALELNQTPETALTELAVVRSTLFSIVEDLKNAIHQLNS